MNKFIVINDINGEENIVNTNHISQICVYNDAITVYINIYCGTGINEHPRYSKINIDEKEYKRIKKILTK